MNDERPCGIRNPNKCFFIYFYNSPTNKHGDDEQDQVKITFEAYTNTLKVLKLHI